MRGPLTKLMRAAARGMRPGSWAMGALYRFGGSFQACAAGHVGLACGGITADTLSVKGAYGPLLRLLSWQSLGGSVVWINDQYGLAPTRKVFADALRYLRKRDRRKAMYRVALPECETVTCG